MVADQPARRPWFDSRPVRMGFLADTLLQYVSLQVLRFALRYYDSIIFILIRSNKMQKYTYIYLLQNHSTCFRCPSHPSSGVNQNVTAPSGTGHSIWATTFLQRGHLATLEESCCSDTMTYTRGCSYSFKCSWWWVRWTPETCRMILQ